MRVDLGKVDENRKSRAGGINQRASVRPPLQTSERAMCKHFDTSCCAFLPPNWIDLIEHGVPL